MNPWLRWFTPIAMIAATVLLINFETQPDAPLWWRVWLGFVYVAAMVMAVLQWWGSRRTP
jgi:hypothetical protein